MFVYKTATHQPTPSRSFTDSVSVILSALVLGGVSRVVPALPMAALVATVLVVAWYLGEGAAAEEPDWVQRLSLASTGLLYLGLGHCLGLVVFLLLPLATVIRRKFGV
jgi:hypothetical protein